MKRLIFLTVTIFAVLFFGVQAHAAVTLVTNNVGTYGFVANANSADYTGCEELVAAVSGKSIYVERVVITSDTATNFTIGAGETGGAVTTVVIGPVYLAANTSISFVFSRPIKLAANTALVVDAAGAGNATVIVQGYIK